MEKKYFGTDGIRGRVGQSSMTPTFVMQLGWAIGQILSQQNKKKVLIGKDTRSSGCLLETAIQAGLSAAGICATWTARTSSTTISTSPSSTASLPPTTTSAGCSLAGWLGRESCS